MQRRAGERGQKRPALSRSAAPVMTESRQGQDALAGVGGRLCRRINWQRTAGWRARDAGEVETRADVDKASPKACWSSAGTPGRARISRRPALGRAGPACCRATCAQWPAGASAGEGSARAVWAGGDALAARCGRASAGRTRSLGLLGVRVGDWLAGVCSRDEGEPPRCFTTP